MIVARWRLYVCAMEFRLHRPLGKCYRNDYAEAFETGYSGTRRFLLARGAPLEEAEEIAQAAWARGWEFRDQLRDPGLVGYLGKFHREKFVPGSFSRAASKPRLKMAMPSTLSTSMPSKLGRLLDRCPQRDRQLLEQSLEGYSAEEIADSEGITPTGIRVRILRIRQMLRDQLNLTLTTRAEAN